MAKKILDTAGALGLAVRLHRGAKRWKQIDLANAISSGVTQSHISKIESGAVSPSNRALEKIGAALGISPRVLWDTAEQILATYSDKFVSEDYLMCLTETGVPKDEVLDLVAQVDVQTLARYERLSNSLSTGEFSRGDFAEFVSLIDSLTCDKGPFVQIVAGLSKQLGDLLCKEKELTESRGRVH